VLNQEERSAQQSAALLKTLSEIAALSVDEGQDLPYWRLGLFRVSQIARLVVSQVLPSELETMQRLEKSDPELTVISTLGGALFLHSSVEVLAREDGTSQYRDLGLRLAELTDAWGGRAGVLEAAAGSEWLTLYMEGLKAFAERDGAIFTMEHPFHFRVLLEVLSGENRRYPAEPVLNMRALSRIWSDAIFWDRFAWSRDQLPVVANELRQGPRNIAFVQHYSAFGRTPLTSSFAKLSYETRSRMRVPAGLPWPEEFQDHRDRPVHNEPNTVSEVYRATRRQQSLGRLWRGTPHEGDLRWLAGQLITWDGQPVYDENLADRIWDASAWLGQGFPVDALSEVRTGAWLIETLRLHLEKLLRIRPPAGGHDKADDLTKKEITEFAELGCVLKVMMLFAEDYINGDGDGVPGLKRSLNTFERKPEYADFGRLMDRRAQLENMVTTGAERLKAEIARAAAILPDAEN
jgi:hypothetical protein